MTPAATLLSAEPEAAFTTTALVVMAAASGVALALAFGTLPLTSPRSGRRLGTRARIAVALLPPAAAALFLVGRSARMQDEDTTGLQFYILGCLSLAVMRVLFAGWLRRAGDAHASGAPQRTSPTKVGVVLLMTFVLVVASLAVLLTWLPSLGA